MKMTNTNILVILIVLIFICLSCTNDISDNYIASVGNIPITEYEFTMRYNFNPYLTQYYNTNEAKKAILSSLIAEKLLALESVDYLQLTQDIQNKIEQHKKEIIIEQFRKDSIESQIEVTDIELQREYKKSLKEIHIKYVAFNSLSKADKIKKDIENGLTYERAVRNYMNKQGWKDEAIPEKTVKWNSEIYDLEEKLFALKSGDISNPLKINGDYYLVKVQDTKIKHTNSTDYSNRLPALRDRILKEKIKNRYTEFFKKNILSILGDVDWEKLDDAFELFIKDVEFNGNQSQSHPFSDDKALSDEVYVSYETQKSQLKNTIIVNFPNGSNWDLEDLMTAIKYGPFSFNYKNKIAFKKSFKQNILLALEYDAIYQLAIEAGYNDNETVLIDIQIWETYYRAGDYRYQLLHNAELINFTKDSVKYQNSNQLTPRQLFRLTYLDKYLQSLSEKYVIKINKTKYKSLNLNKTDMVVMKSHFAHRMVAPLIEPLTGLPKWQDTFSSILKKFGIS